MPAPRQTIRVPTRQLTDEQLHRLGADRGDRIERRMAPNGTTEFLVNGRVVHGLVGEYDARTDQYRIEQPAQSMRDWPYPGNQQVNEFLMNSVLADNPRPRISGAYVAPDMVQTDRFSIRNAENDRSNTRTATESLRGLRPDSTRDWWRAAPVPVSLLESRIAYELSRLRSLNLVPVVIAINPSLFDELRSHLEMRQAVRPRTPDSITPPAADGNVTYNIIVDEQATLLGIRVVEDIYTESFAIAVTPPEN